MLVLEDIVNIWAPNDCNNKVEVKFELLGSFSWNCECEFRLYIPKYKVWCDGHYNGFVPDLLFYLINSLLFNLLRWLGIMILQSSQGNCTKLNCFYDSYISIISGIDICNHIWWRR